MLFCLLIFPGERKKRAFADGGWVWKHTHKTRSLCFKNPPHEGPSEEGATGGLNAAFSFLFQLKKHGEEKRVPSKEGHSNGFVVVFFLLKMARSTDAKRIARSTRFGWAGLGKGVPTDRRRTMLVGGKWMAN